jgi:O-methyltransferase
MASFYYTKVRPKLKRAARALGIKEKRLRKEREIPPDFDTLTTQVLRTVSPFTMTSTECVHELVNAVRYVVGRGIAGSLVECGVWRGGSAMAMALVLKELGETSRDIYLYDTYEGMSAPTDADVSFDGKAAAKRFEERQLSADSSDWCRSTIDEVEANLASTGYPADKLHFIKGKVEDTLPGTLPAGPIAILRLDTDWYESTRHELEHLYPLLADRGVLIIDDYGHWEGSKKAVDEYIAAHGLKLLLGRVDFSARIAIKQ